MIFVTFFFECHYLQIAKFDYVSFSWLQWFPYKARAQAETNTQFLMRLYCLVPGNSVQNMVAALHLCLRYDVRDILLSAFGHEGEGEWYRMFISRARQSDIVRN